MRSRRAGLILAFLALGPRARSEEARILVDAGRVEGRIDPRLYGQFVEFMFEGVKGGLSAELLRNRGFEEPANAIGLSRHWERYPDDRNDDYGLNLRWDDSVAYPVSLDSFEERPVQHSLRVDVGAGVVERHGVYQPRIPVRSGVAYQGYFWLKTTGYHGRVLVALEEDVSGGRTYAEAEIRDVEGDWTQHRFVLRAERTDPHARLAILFEGKGRVWVDQVSLLPDDAVGGVRADVQERVVATGRTGAEPRSPRAARHVGRRQSPAPGVLEPLHERDPPRARRRARDRRQRRPGLPLEAGGRPP